MFDDLTITFYFINPFCFLGDVLQSHPGTYYHYEPLMDFDIKQVRHGEAAKQALHNLHHLLNCDYSEMGEY